jgi:flagellar hook assembly protein FlgD
VTVDILDVRGARVRRVLDEARPAGPSAASWDGRDQAGRAVVSGVYFVVVRTGEASDRAKVVRLP